MHITFNLSKFIFSLSSGCMSSTEILKHVGIVWIWLWYMKQQSDTHRSPAAVSGPAGVSAGPPPRSWCACPAVTLRAAGGWDCSGRSHTPPDSAGSNPPLLTPPPLLHPSLPPPPPLPSSPEDCFFQTAHPLLHPASWSVCLYHYPAESRPAPHLQVYWETKWPITNRVRFKFNS